jgi:predicted metal-dependent enzyme (double-stranded beta helix superfamily)
VRSFGSAYVHDVTNRGPQRAISLHVYAPRLHAITRYSTADGTLVAVRVDRAGEDW